MIQNIIRKLRIHFKDISVRNSFVRNFFTLTSGTLVAQALPVLFSPILTRLFSPDEFGLLAIITSITAILSVISTGKYETAILIAKNQKDAATLSLVSLIISFLISVLTLIIFYFFSNTIITILNQPRLEYWIYFCPLVSFLISIYQIYNEWCIKKSQFFNLSLNKILNTGSITLSNLTFGLLKVLNGGLIFGEVIGRFITAIISVYKVLKFDLFIFKSISIPDIILILKKNIDCPKFVLPAQLINTIGGQIIVLMIASFYGETELGFFSMTVLVLSVPASVVSLAVRDVFRQRANEDYNKNQNCIIIFNKTVKVISGISILIFGVLFFILPDLFTFVFGAEWRIAGEYAQILSPMVMISFVSESVIGMFIIAKKMKALFIWQLVYAGVNAGSMLIGYLFFSEIKIALIFYVIGKSLVHLLSLIMSYRFAIGKKLHLNL
jgi:O-antigen/teichoic acid export membrane protein